MPLRGLELGFSVASGELPVNREGSPGPSGNGQPRLAEGRGRIRVRGQSAKEARGTSFAYDDVGHGVRRTRGATAAVRGAARSRWRGGPSTRSTNGRALVGVPRCPRCRGVASPEHVGQLHKHRRAVALVPRMIRVPLYPVAAVDVERAVRWLDEHWGDAVFIPDELRDVAAVA